MSCQACRLSKVKCEARAGTSCVRCSRLGLTCQFKASNRGRPNVRRDVARLGPAVRALLKATQPEDGSQAKQLETELARTREPDVDTCILSWRGHDCQQMMVEAIGNREGQIALIKHWLLIGVRSGNCALLGNVLILASKCGLKLDDVTMQIDRTTPQITFEMPSYLVEWFEQPGRMCCARGQREGYVTWRPNAAFTEAIGNEEFLKAKLAREHPQAVANTDFLVCSAEIFITTPFHPEDRMQIVEVNASLWSQVSSNYEAKAEVVASKPVRCLLKQPSGQWDYKPCQLSARTVVRPGSREVFSVFSLAELPLIKEDASPLVCSAFSGGYSRDEKCGVDGAMSTDGRHFLEGVPQYINLAIQRCLPQQIPNCLQPPPRAISTPSPIGGQNSLRTSPQQPVLMPPMSMALSAPSQPMYAYPSGGASYSSEHTLSIQEDPFPPLMLTKDNPLRLKQQAVVSETGVAHVPANLNQVLHPAFMEDLCAVGQEDLMTQLDLDDLASQLMSD